MRGLRHGETISPMWLPPVRTIALAKGAMVFVTALGDDDCAYLERLGVTSIEGSRDVADPVDALTAAPASTCCTIPAAARSWMLRGLTHSPY